MPAETLEKDPAEAAAPVLTGVDASGEPCCEKCGYPGKATACPSCGWYPSLGIHVEVDEAFEAVNRAAVAAAAAEDSSDETPAPKNDESYATAVTALATAVPLWGWVLIGTAVATLAACVGVRVAVGVFPAWWTTVSVSLLAGGLFAALVTHVTCFVLVSSGDAELGVADLVIKPAKSWARLAGELPDRLWLANSLNTSLCVALGAAVIIGGIPYERLLDWGYVQPPKKNLLAAIANSGGGGGGDGRSLEDAIGDLTDKAGVDQLSGGDANKPKRKPAEKPRQTVEALIIGYRVDTQDRLAELLLAVERQGKMKYAGRVRPELDTRERAELLASFQSYPASRPLVKTSDSGVWLRPRFTCRVSYTSWPDKGRPREIEWDTLLGEIDVP